MFQCQELKRIEAKVHIVPYMVSIRQRFSQDVQNVAEVLKLIFGVEKPSLGLPAKSAIQIRSAVGGGTGAVRFAEWRRAIFHIGPTDREKPLAANCF